MKFKKFLKYGLFLVQLITVTFLYSFSSKRNLEKKITKIEVEFENGKNNFLTHIMVNKLLIQNNKTIQNQKKSVIDLYVLENNVSKNSYVEKVKVFYDIKGVLKAHIKQRTPIARIISENSSYYVDKQGVEVPLSDNYSARVLLVSGIKNFEEIKEIMPLLTFILEDNFLQKEIVGIQKLAANSYQLSVRSGSYKIEFGDLTNISLKFKKLKVFYNTTFKDKTIQKYNKINVKYHNQVVCTK